MFAGVKLLLVLVGVLCLWSAATALLFVSRCAAATQFSPAALSNGTVESPL